MLSDTDFAKGMAVLANAFVHREIPAGTAGVYHQALNRAGVEPAEWEEMIWRAIASLKYFPTVAELLGFRPGSSAQDSFNRLIAAAERGVEPILTETERAAVAALGGWNRFGLTSYYDLTRQFRVFQEAFDGAQTRRGNLRLIERAK